MSQVWETKPFCSNVQIKVSKTKDMKKNQYIGDVVKSAMKETKGMCRITKKREEAEVKARVQPIVSGYVMLK